MGTNQDCLFRNEDLLPIGSYRSDFEIELSRKLDAVLGTMSWLDFDLAPSAIVELQWALSDMTHGQSETVSMMFEPVGAASGCCVEYSDD